MKSQSVSVLGSAAVGCLTDSGVSIRHQHDHGDRAWVNHALIGRLHQHLHRPHQCLVDIGAWIVSKGSESQSDTHPDSLSLSTTLSSLPLSSVSPHYLIPSNPLLPYTPPHLSLFLCRSLSFIPPFSLSVLLSPPLGLMFWMYFLASATCMVLPGTSSSLQQRTLWLKSTMLK